MKKTNALNSYSVLTGIIAALIGADANGAVRVGNLSRSYADAYNQVNAQRAQAQYTDQQYNAAGITQEAELPVRVANADLAKQVTSGTGTLGINRLQSCAGIYPDGEFAWDTPTVGRGRGGASTCVAVVELRAIGMGANGSDAVLARANLASGDAFKCNISDFPENSYTADAANVVFPADKEPTVDDVVKVMNDEQKKNAGIKIAAGTVIGALGGNMAGKNEIGEDSLLGTGKGKMQGTGIGALTGAAIAAGNVYSGKVAGDMILSTGVNAAAGSVMANMMASGDSVLRIEDCKIGGKSEKCLWGMVVTNKPLKTSDGQTDANGNALSGDVKTAFFNISDGSTTLVCDKDGKNCSETELIAIKLEAYPNTDVDTLKEQDFEKIQANNCQGCHILNDDKSVSTGSINNGRGIYVKIASAGLPDRQIAAMVPVSDSLDKTFGADNSDWRTWRKSNQKATIYGRSSRGEAFDLTEIYSLSDFYPMKVNAEDGGLIDLGNKARLKSTLTGAGIGGAMGAFTAYQGAQKDIDDRWVTSVREYKDSLQKVYCVTGKRFLGYYNDTIIIPNMSE